MKRIGKLIKNNKKLLFGVIIGVLLTSTTVYAVQAIATSIAYDNTTSGLQATNVQDAVDELYTKVPKSPTGCTTPPFNEGDYIQLIPSSKNYVVSSSLTGYTDQTINPSELTLWRVIKKNPCNVEVVSEYSTSREIGFSGTTGYANFVGAMNEIAKQYMNKYTSGARMIGYNGQTEYLKDTSEFGGSGDTLYLNDYSLLTDIYGNAKTSKVGATTTSSYWISSRAIDNNNYRARVVGSNGTIYVSSSYICRFESDDWISGDQFYAVRPVLILKSGLTITSGSGTKESPYILN